MKRYGLIFLLWLCSCTASKQIMSGPEVIRDHPGPIRIFGIGYWSSGYCVLTLLDAHKSYFTVIVKKNDDFEVGGLYPP